MGLIKRNKNAQASMEYLMILGFIAVIIIPLIMFFYFQSEDYRESAIENQLYQIAQDIVVNVEKVYYYGEPSMVTMKFTLPDKVASAQVRDHEVLFLVQKRSGDSDVYETTEVNMTGSLPSTPGLHTITIESRGSYVIIS
ncbi:hypothetical protein JW968_01260 [Candidatus Woesearchaeota archaeon]|nr:hypothetical protein [Candidatus Woesearchaeota archaeon]